MAPQLKLFVSHEWERSDLYEELIRLLDCVKDFEWHNLSISSAEALAIATGEDASPQRHQLLMDRLQAIEDDTKEIDASLAIASGRRTDAQVEADDLASYRQVDKLLQAAREKIMEPSYVEKVRRLEQLRVRYAGKDTDSAQHKVAELISELESTISRLNTERERLSREARACEHNRVDPEHVRLGETGKARDNMIERYPNLALAIRNRVARADAVLVIASPHSSYLQWIEFEYQEAFVLGKPIFGLLHPALTDRVPPDLRRFGVVPVNWNGVAIVETLKTVVLDKSKLERYADGYYDGSLTD